MNQPGKLDTITPSKLRKAAVVAPASPSPTSRVSPSANRPASTSISITTDRSPVESTPASINISIDKTAKTSVAFFSLQNLMTLLPGWSVSLVGHGVLLVLLTVIATSPIRNGSAVQLDALMVGEATAPVVEDMLNENEMTDVNLLKVDVAALNSEASDEVAEIIRDDGFEVSLMEGNSDGIGLEAMAQTGLTPLPNQDEGGIAGDTEGKSTQFFGTRAMGSRFVFIIDASDSMNEGFRWHHAIRELEKSIESLGPEEEAMVLLYNFQTFPMFDIPPKDLKLLPVTDKFKTELSKWLGNQIPIGGTRPAHALSYSLTLRPDAIFLLSDGMLADDSIQVLANENVARDPRNGDFSKTPIHTISLGPNEAGAQLMKIIADNNNGEFTWSR